MTTERVYVLIAFGCALVCAGTSLRAADRAEACSFQAEQTAQRLAHEQERQRIVEHVLDAHLTDTALRLEERSRGLTPGSLE